MNILINENQKRFLIVEGLSDNLAKDTKKLFDMTKKVLSDSSKQLKMNLEFKIDMLLEDWLKEKDQKRLGKKLEKDCLIGICYKIDNGYSLIQWKGHTINSLLQHPQGKLTIRVKLNELRREGKEVLNKNIPQELF